MIEIRPRRGTYVIDIDPADVAESFEVRRILECAAAEIAVKKATAEDIAQLRHIAGEMSRLLLAGDYQTIVGPYIDLDRQFHKKLVQLARNNRLTEFCNRLDTHVQIARVRQKFNLSDSQQYTETEHEAILLALERRDARALVKGLAEHIELSKVRTLKAIENHD